MNEIRRIFLEPEVSDDYAVRWGNLNEEELYRFLCDEQGFSESRVRVVVDRMKSFFAQASLEAWTEGVKR